MVIILMVISGYFIGVYWSLFYWWILVVILFMRTGGYSIGGY